MSNQMLPSLHIYTYTNKKTHFGKEFFSDLLLLNDCETWILNY